jgi:hypothetical protein
MCHSMTNVLGDHFPAKRGKSLLFHSDIPIAVE